MQKNIIIGTAGHIDHGKSTLIKALTGDETDRLNEEKERGISIELGFSHLEDEKTRANNLNLGIVDVPGHEKFVNKMLAAAGGIDLALIVIAADEGVMPQTEEHLAILNILQAKEAVIAVNKIDLVEEEWLELIEEDIKEKFVGTFAEKAEMVRVSAAKNQGIKKLKDLLITKALKIEKNDQGELPYYPVDRVFSLSGQGTIVTGTLLRGELEAGSEMMLYPAQKEIRIRSLENHQRELDFINSGSRVGVNISGIEKSEVETGDIIAEKDSLLVSRFFEAELKLLPGLNFTVKNGDRVHFHTAAAERTATLYIYGRDQIFPGESAFIKLKLDEELALFYQEKFVLRRFSPLQTLGGGQILELDPPPRRKYEAAEIITQLQRLKNADLKKAVEEFIRQNSLSTVDLNYLKMKTAVNEEKLKEIIKRLLAEDKVIELAQNKGYLHQKEMEKLKAEILKKLNQYQREHKLRSGIKKEELRSSLDFELTKKEMAAVVEILTAEKLLKEEANLISTADFEIELNAEEEELKEEILAAFRNDLFTPPTREEIIEKYEAAEMLEYLESKDYLLRLTGDLTFAGTIFAEIKSRLQDYFKKNESLELADFRDLLESTRKYALPLLEKSDKLKITKRDGDLRYPGENLAE